MEYAERVVRDCSEMRRRGSGTEGAPVVALTIAARLTVAYYGASRPAAPPLPSLRVTMSAANAEHVVMVLRAGEIDLGLVKDLLARSGLVLACRLGRNLLRPRRAPGRGSCWAPVGPCHRERAWRRPRRAGGRVRAGLGRAARRRALPARRRPRSRRSHAAAEVADVEATKGAVASGLGIAGQPAQELAARLGCRAAAAQLLDAKRDARALRQPKSLSPCWRTKADRFANAIHSFALLMHGKSRFAPPASPIYGAATRDASAHRRSRRPRKVEPGDAASTTCGDGTVQLQPRRAADRQRASGPLRGARRSPLTRERSGTMSGARGTAPDAPALVERAAARVPAAS